MRPWGANAPRPGPPILPLAHPSWGERGGSRRVSTPIPCPSCGALSRESDRIPGRVCDTCGCVFRSRAAVTILPGIEPPPIGYDPLPRAAPRASACRAAAPPAQRDRLVAARARQLRRGESGPEAAVSGGCACGGSGLGWSGAAPCRGGSRRHHDRRRPRPTSAARARSPGEPALRDRALRLDDTQGPRRSLSRTKKDRTTMTRLRTVTALVLAALVGVLAGGCDPCVAAIEVHTQRCNDGDQASCEWLHDNVVGAYCAS